MTKEKLHHHDHYSHESDSDSDEEHHCKRGPTGPTGPAGPSCQPIPESLLCLNDGPSGADQTISTTSTELVFNNNVINKGWSIGTGTGGGTIMTSPNLFNTYLITYSINLTCTRVQLSEMGIIIAEIYSITNSLPVLGSVAITDVPAVVGSNVHLSHSFSAVLGPNEVIDLLIRTSSTTATFATHVQEGFTPAGAATSQRTGVEINIVKIN